MSVTSAAGFRAAGVAAGLKTSGGPDVALVVNDGPEDAVAAVFTANRIKAAPVLWSQQVVVDGRARAVVLNSGGANAATGPAGFADAHETAERVAADLGIGAGDVLVCSTGLIGDRLPMPFVRAGVDQVVAALSPSGGPEAAEAIRTTDTMAKQYAVRRQDGWTIGGMAKGAGMLAPSLATMLCVLTTDAVVDAVMLDKTLRAVTRRTFDRLDADGCLSTNDTVVLMSSGASAQIPGAAEFESALDAVCQNLTQQLLRDAEGATKEIAITVAGAADESDAVEVARAVARNNLLKCALFGNDPNWGRALAAVGTCQATFDPDRVDIAINGVAVCVAAAAGTPRDQVDLTGRFVAIDVDLHAGASTATVWTTDLSHGYVAENSAYST